MDKNAVNELRGKIESLSTDLTRHKNMLAHIECNCIHKWGDTKSGSRETLEFVPGTMVVRGSDMWHEQVAQTVRENIWTRECSVCGKIETTNKQSLKTVRVPEF